MFGERHDLPHEFPEYRDVIQQLRDSNGEFARLYEEYEALDDEILKIEQNVEPVSDFYAEDLKKRRVHLKDQLYFMLKNHHG